MISDGPFGTASKWLIDIASNGGTVLIEKNDMGKKARKASNQSNTIMIAEEGEGNAPAVRSTFGKTISCNTQPRGTNFVNNFGTRPARLVDNILGGEINPLRGLGSIE